MITEEKLVNLYEEVLEKQAITTKELTNCGFSSYDVAILSKNGTLKRVKRGVYTFSAEDLLFHYGEKLFSLKEYSKASTIFLKCKKLNPVDFRIDFKLFFLNVLHYRYKDAFPYFISLYDNDVLPTYDKNFYLFLFNRIIEIPEPYQLYAKSIKWKDIMVDLEVKEYSSLEFQNRIRNSALNGCFFKAVEYITAYKKENQLSEKEQIAEIFIRRADMLKKEERDQIVDLFQAKKYRELIEYFKKVREKRFLSKEEDTLLNLIEVYFEIMETKMLPKPKNIRTNNVLEAIRNKDYKQALLISDEQKKKGQGMYKEYFMNVLLHEINDFIEKNLTSLESFSTKEKKKVEQPSTFLEVKNFLLNQDFDHFFPSLSSYLESINRKEFEFLITNVIKISVLEKDFQFVKPISILNNLARGGSVLNMSTYVRSFYKALNENKLEEAEIYFSILSNDFLENVKRDLEMKKKEQENLKMEKESFTATSDSEEPRKEIGDDFKELGEDPIEDFGGVTEEEGILQEPKEKTLGSKSIPTSSLNEIEREKSFILQKLEHLKKEGISILDPMTSERRKKIHEIIKELPDVQALEIGPECKRQIVLRYIPTTLENIDYLEIQREGSNAYKEKNYSLCIEKYRLLLENGTINLKVCSSLGLSYLKLGRKKWAIDYLTVAQEMKDPNSSFDYADLIAELKGIIPESDKKPRVKMREDEFTKDLFDDYAYLSSFIEDRMSYGFSFQEACLQEQLGGEEQSIVQLLFAKKYYTMGNYNIGDQYIKMVEQSKNKTPLVKEMIRELQKNKKFYIYRTEQKRMALTNKDSN